MGVNPRRSQNSVVTATLAFRGCTGAAGRNQLLGDAARHVLGEQRPDAPALTDDFDLPGDTQQQRRDEHRHHRQQCREQATPVGNRASDHEPGDRCGECSERDEPPTCTGEQQHADEADDRREPPEER